MILAVVLSVSLALGTTGQQEPRHAPCSRIPDHKVAHIIRCSAKRFGVDPEAAIAVARCESSLRPSAIGGTGGNYYGLFQHHRDYWAGRWALWGVHGRWRVPNDPLDALANALVTMRMVRAVGWGPWECQP